MKAFCRLCSTSTVEYILQITVLFRRKNLYSIDKECETYCEELLNSYNEERVWNIKWNFLENPSFHFFFKKNFKKSISDSAQIRILEHVIIFRAKNEEVIIPNDPVVIDTLEEVVKYAKKEYQSFEEDQRLLALQKAKERGYLPSDTYTPSPINKDYQPNSIGELLRKAHVERRKKHSV